MSSPKLIVIVGATGVQGGAIANTFLQEPGWKVRALTRSASSTKAQALAARGAQVVEADIDDPATLPAAFEGANAIFAATNFMGLYIDPANQNKPKPGQDLIEWVAEHETQQINSISNAAAKVPTLERYIISSLSNATKWSKGKYTHAHAFVSKARAVDYVKDSLPELWAKTSTFQAGWFLTNLVGNPFQKPIKGEDGTIQFMGTLQPDVKQPWIAAEEDCGPFVKALVQEPAGKNLIAYRGWVTQEELAAIFAKVTGLKTKVVTLPLGEYHVPLSDDWKTVLKETSAYASEFGYEGRDDPSLVHPKDLKSLPALGTLEDWIKKQDWEKAFEG
ncbi:hypothetical protein FALBO_14447 [Fusarium albosuccineum]|uniref:NmrA-like domain-containing protein n=1 Tax=Fusarium albosuccineum TaxID=1237068 RepID=A0A8H4L069_9HYPO|nr:hypothetical protein FALBO_14447 [Fusarium albosuccineum]